MSDRANSTLTLQALDETRAFRETFLHYFTEPKDREALLRLGSMLFDYWYAEAGHMPDPPEPSVHYDLRAGVADLRYVENYLRRIVAGAPEVHEVTLREGELAALAFRAAESLAEITEVLEVEVRRSGPD